MEEKSKNLPKCKTRSNKKAELNNILTSGTTLETSVNFRIKKKNQHDPAKTHEKRRNRTYLSKRINQMIKHCHQVQKIKQEKLIKKEKIFKWGAVLKCGENKIL